MDLRVLKTKKAIKEAFLELRCKKALEKIKVVDICKLALINKSTFYSHYEDVFDLSDKLEDELISSSFDDFEYKDCLMADTKVFLENINSTMDKHKEMFDTLFGGRDDVLSLKLERMLREYYCKSNMPADEYILLTFLISGGMRTMQILSSEKRFDDKILYENIAGIINRINLKAASY